MILIRPTSWLKGARRDFEAFPFEAQEDAAQALSIAARGGKADVTKPFKGVGSGVFEITLKHRGDAFRVIYQAVEKRCQVRPCEERSDEAILYVVTALGFRSKREGGRGA
jgi:phage-related protein